MFLGFSALLIFPIFSLTAGSCKASFCPAARRWKSLHGSLPYLTQVHRHFFEGRSTIYAFLMWRALPTLACSGGTQGRKCLHFPLPSTKTGLLRKGDYFICNFEFLSYWRDLIIVKQKFAVFAVIIIKCLIWGKQWWIWFSISLCDRQGIWS